MSRSRSSCLAACASFCVLSVSTAQAQSPAPDRTVAAQGPASVTVVKPKDRTHEGPIHAAVEAAEAKALPRAIADARAKAAELGGRRHPHRLPRHDQSIGRGVGAGRNRSSAGDSCAHRCAVRGRRCLGPDPRQHDGQAALGGRARGRHAVTRQPRHQHHPPRTGPVRGDLQQERGRLFLRRHHRQRLQPGARHLYRRRPPELEWGVRRDEEPGRRPDRRAVPPARGLWPARHPVRGGRLFGQPRPRDAWHEPDVAGIRTLPGDLLQLGERLCLSGHRGRSRARRSCSARPACTPAAARTRTRSTSRPRIRAAASRTACRSTWR